MADEADCPVCGGEHPVTWLITHLNPAATIRACEQDFEAAVLALLANRLEVDAGWLTDVINGAVDAVNQDAEAANNAAADAVAAADDMEPGFEPADERELRDLTPEKFARKYGTDDEDQAAGDD